MHPGLEVDDRAGRVVGDGIPPSDGAIERASSADNPDAFGRAGSFTSDGRFRWSTDEETAVTLRATPWKAPPSAPRTFECRDGKRYDDVVFEIPRASADLAGSIVTASGAPAAMAFIDVHGLSPGTTDAQERADGDGAWEVFGLPPGDYVVVSRVPGQGVATARVTAPGHGTVLTLSGTGSLAKGMEEGTFSLEVNCPTEGPAFGEISEQFLVSVHGNSYQVDGLPACKVSMVARNSVWRTPSHEVDVPAGGVATTDLDLTPVVTKEVYGVVRDRLVPRRSGFDWFAAPWRTRTRALATRVWAHSLARIPPCHDYPRCHCHARPMMNHPAVEFSSLETQPASLRCALPCPRDLPQRI